MGELRELSVVGIKCSAMASADFMRGARLGPLGGLTCRVSVSESVPVSQHSLSGLIRLSKHHFTSTFLGCRLGY